MLYLECSSGISGDMAVAALLDLGTPESRKAREEAVLSALRSLPVQGFEARISRVLKAGLEACDFDVVLDAAHENHDHDMEYLYGHAHSHAHSHAQGACRGEHAHEHEHEHEDHHGHQHKHAHSHEHRNLFDVITLIEQSTATPRAKEIASRIFRIIAAAEAQAHGKPMDEVHFHEVGAVDSIADVLAFAVCLDHLNESDVIITELCDGKGSVRCQHGIIPVPVPAVLNIVRAHDVPLRILDVQGELVTPTGAAFAAAIRTRKQLPERFTVKSAGIGAGKRAYETPGILRALIIEEA